MDLLLDLGVCTGHQNLFFNHQSTHCSKGGIHFSYVFIKRDSKISISKNLKQSKSVCKGSSPYSFLGWSFCGLYETSVIWFYFCSVAESQIRFYGFGKLVGSWLLLFCLTPKEISEMFLAMRSLLSWEQPGGYSLKLHGKTSNFC